MEAGMKSGFVVSSVASWQMFNLYLTRKVAGLQWHGRVCFLPITLTVPHLVAAMLTILCELALCANGCRSWPVMDHVYVLSSPASRVRVQAVTPSGGGFTQQWW
jgi:hypothetical protein